MRVQNEAPIFNQIPVNVRRSLLPFAEIFESILLPQVWRNGNTIIDNERIPALGKRIKRRLRKLSGRPVHSAIACYGLRLCCYYHVRALRRTGKAADMNLHQDLIDAVFGTIAKMEELFGTYQLRLLLG